MRRPVAITIIFVVFDQIRDLALPKKSMETLSVPDRD